MQNKKVTPKKQAAPIHKPFLKGPWHSGFAIRRGFHILGYQILLVFIFLFIGQLLMVDSVLLRILLNLLVVIGFGSLMYAEGAKAGVDDVSYAEIALSRVRDGETDYPD